MCGIVACLDQSGESIKIVIESLFKLQNRGYDSAGIGYVHNSNLNIIKYVSDEINAVNKLRDDTVFSLKSCVVMGHTRWATHGKKIIENTHPHCDMEPRFALVHNGIIENHSQLRKELTANGYSFYGQTDSEILVNYIHYIFSLGGEISDITSKIIGTWAILLIDKNDQQKIWFLKNGTPLIIGFDDDHTRAMCVSEFSGFDAKITKYMIINDETHGYLQLVNNHVDINYNYPYQFHKMNNNIYSLTPDPYPHWTLREIHEQPESIKKLLLQRLSYDDNTKSHVVDFPEFCDGKINVKSLEHIIFLACGTSYHAAQYANKFIRDLRLDVTSEVIDGAEFESYDIPNNRNISALLISQSGETRDLYRCLQINFTRGGCMFVYVRWKRISCCQY